MNKYFIIGKSHFYKSLTSLGLVSLHIETDAKKSYWPKIRLIIKICNFYPIKLIFRHSHELVILTKFNNNWIKILDFYYRSISGSVTFFASVSTENSIGTQLCFEAVPNLKLARTFDLVT